MYKLQSIIPCSLMLTIKYFVISYFTNWYGCLVGQAVCHMHLNMGMKHGI